MGDHHVLVGAGALVEVGALIQAQGLGDVDLDVVDEVAVPDRLEQAVGEAEGQDVLRRLLAEEVVDPEDLPFVECLVDEVVQLDSAGQVGAEWLLHHDSGPVHQVGVLQHRDHRAGRLWWHRQVVQPADVGAELGFGGRDGRGQRIGARALRHVGDCLGEPRPLFLAELVGAEVLDGLFRQLEEVLGGDVLQGCRDDLDVGCQVGLIQIGQAGNQLASGQIARRAEQNDDVRVHRIVVMTAGTGAGMRIGDRLRFACRHSRHTPTGPTFLHGYRVAATAKSQTGPEDVNR